MQTIDNLEVKVREQLAIWKFSIHISDRVSIFMPKNATILSVQEQNGETCLWALVDTMQPPEQRQFRIFGTGHPIESIEHLTFIATVQSSGGYLVWHIFEEAH